MRVCLISTEIFAWGKYGGFGRATRLIGRELVKRGVQVAAVVPRRYGQAAIEDLDGMCVYGFRRQELFRLPGLFRWIDADIYHSQEPSTSTWLAMSAMPQKEHLVTFRDPRNLSDWLVELSLPSVSPWQVLSNWLYEDNIFVHKAVRKADGWYAAAKMLIQKAKIKYRLPDEPTFLPTPVEVPERKPKAAKPTVCYLSRWDRRKRPQIFFELARAFPEVRFIAVGGSRDSAWEKSLREQYGGLENLEMVGFINQFESDRLSQILHESWILVNTAAREGLPNAFIEACAHGCAILSAVDPDGFASRFGYHVRDDDFAQGLRSLLEGGLWLNRAEEGYAYVRTTFSLDQAMQAHLMVYQQHLESGKL